MDRSIHPSQLHVAFPSFGRPFLTSANVLCALTTVWHSQSSQHTLPALPSWRTSRDQAAPHQDNQTSEANLLNTENSPSMCELRSLNPHVSISPILQMRKRARCVPELAPGHTARAAIRAKSTRTTKPAPLTPGRGAERSPFLCDIQNKAQPS